jgi:hypothetical protein
MLAYTVCVADGARARRMLTPTWLPVGIPFPNWVQVRPPSVVL